MRFSIRLAMPSDAFAIREIYAPFVRDTPVSFEIEPPSVEEMASRIANTLQQFPWLVYEENGEVLGYVYACAHRARAAYRFAVDTAVYIHPRAHRKGVGRALYTSLIRLLVLQHFYRAYAGITLPNAGSVGLHQTIGFTPVGVYRAVGFKAGAWHDVGWWQLNLQPLSQEPREPLAPGELQNSPQWREALAREWFE